MKNIVELNKLLVEIIKGSLLTHVGEIITEDLADERARNAVQAMQMELDELMNANPNWIVIKKTGAGIVGEVTE